MLCLNSLFCYIAVGDYLNSSGFTPVVERLAEPIKNKIVTNAKVTRIRYLNRRPKIAFTDSSGLTNVINARKVIVTVPLGVLKKGDEGIKFKPPLPEWKRHVSHYLHETHYVASFKIFAKRHVHPQTTFNAESFSFNLPGVHSWACIPN